MKASNSLVVVIKIITKVGPKHYWCVAPLETENVEAKQHISGSLPSKVIEMFDINLLLF